MRDSSVMICSFNPDGGVLNPLGGNQYMFTLLLEGLCLDEFITGRGQIALEL